MRYLFLILSYVFTLALQAQQRLTIQDAEQLLQKNNLQLVAEQYHISASRAAVIQAKIWEQPFVSAEINVLNPQDNKVFDVGSSGQKAIAIQQLIYLGGKKKNEVAFAKSNVALAELEFEQLLRNLKYQLNQTFYNVYFDRQKINSLDVQIAIIDTLVVNYNVQAQKGNIPLREVVRLQSLVLNLKNERNSVLKDMVEAQQNLSLLIGMAEPVLPTVDESALLTKYQHQEISKDSILSAAIEGNIDYLSAIKSVENQALFLKWQKSLAVPDVTTGISYDQRGGAFQNQVNFTLGIPLPLWNRNKGNIKAAKAQLQQATLDKEYKKVELQSKVETLWQLWQQQAHQMSSMDKSTMGNLEAVYNGMISNFQKRNISMLEFTDFMESYSQSSIQINEIKKALILSGINLNYITNKDIF